LYVQKIQVEYRQITDFQLNIAFLQANISWHSGKVTDCRHCNPRHHKFGITVLILYS